MRDFAGCRALGATSLGVAAANGLPDGAGPRKPAVPALVATDQLLNEIEGRVKRRETSQPRPLISGLGT